MSGIAYLMTKKELAARLISADAVGKVGEALWGTTTFLLFLALGPFSAVAAVFGVFSLLKGQGTAEPETVV